MGREKDKIQKDPKRRKVMKEFLAGFQVDMSIKNLPVFVQV